jgi:hypothetical protein
MTATAAPFGIRPLYSPTGIVRPGPGGSSGPQIESGYATALYQNSPVAISAAGYLVAAAAGSRAIGVFQGVEYVDSTGRPIWLNQWVANTVLSTGTIARAYFTQQQAELVYEIQANDTLTIAAIGQQYDWTALAGNALTGLSSVALNVASAAANAGLRVIGLVPYPDNDWGDAFPIVQVQFSEHQYVADIASV